MQCPTMPGTGLKVCVRVVGGGGGGGVSLLQCSAQLKLNNKISKPELGLNGFLYGVLIIKVKQLFGGLFEGLIGGLFEGLIGGLLGGLLEGLSEDFLEDCQRLLSS